MRLLVVEDSNRLRESLVDGLSSVGFAVDAAPDGREGLAWARAIEYDVIILDLMLPEIDGMTLLSSLRESGGNAPVLILSARDRTEHRVEGLRAGADDYLVKPFAFEELLARIESLCRRPRGHSSNVIPLGSLSLDLSAKIFLVGGDAIEFTPREYAMLEFLVLSAGRVVSRSEIEEHVYDSEHQVWSNAVDSAIAAIRRKLRAKGVIDLVETRRGRGYIVKKPAP